MKVVLHIPPTPLCPQMKAVETQKKGNDHGFHPCPSLASLEWSFFLAFPSMSFVFTHSFSRLENTSDSLSLSHLLSVSMPDSQHTHTHTHTKKISLCVRIPSLLIQYVYPLFIKPQTPLPNFKALHIWPQLCQLCQSLKWNQAAGVLGKVLRNGG